MGIKPNKGRCLSLTSPTTCDSNSKNRGKPEMDDLRGHLVLLRKEDQRGREDQSYRKDADTGSLMKGLLKQPLGWASVVCTWLVYNPPFSGDCICWGSLSTRRDHQFDLWVGHRQSDARHPHLCPWNVWSSCLPADRSSPRTQPWDSNVLLRPFGLHTWLNPVKASL